MKKLIFALAIVVAASVANAQPVNLGPQPSPENNPNNAVPIDGGASLLIAAGAAFGYRRLKGNKAK
jgi:hypothetical protein